MKPAFVFFLIIFSFVGNGQTTIEEVLDSTCNCFSKVLETPETDTKFDFEFRFGVCLDSLSIRAQRVDSQYSDVYRRNHLIHNELKNRCKYFDQIDSLQQFYSTHTFETIANAEQCKIMMSGTFVTYGDADSTIITMTKKKQVLNFKSGAYTKSKVVWIDDCTYKLIRIDSTDPYESQMVKPGDERIVKIIHVTEEGMVYYEILVKGKSYSGRLIKIGD